MALPIFHLFTQAHCQLAALCCYNFNSLCFFTILLLKNIIPTLFLSIIFVAEQLHILIPTISTFLSHPQITSTRLLQVN